MGRSSILMWGAVALLAGCSGTPELTTGTGGTGGGTGTGGATLFLGSGSGATFQDGVIGLSSSSLSAGGTTTLQVSLVNEAGTFYTTATTITFSSPCQTQNLATIAVTGVTPASPMVTTSTGTVSATYTATGCTGADVITATATPNGQSLTATGTVTVAAAGMAGSIAFVPRTASLGLNGAGRAVGAAASTATFRVLNASGGPRAGVPVTFALNSGVDGVSIAPSTAVTDADGQVQTSISSRSAAASVRVRATTAVHNGTISTESDPLCSLESPGAMGSDGVTIPSGNHANFSPAPGASLALDAKGAAVTFAIADDNNLPMPAGTTVAASLAGSAGMIAGPNTYDWPCASPAGGAQFTFNVLPPSTGTASGNLILTVTTPDGNATTALYSLRPK